MKSFFKNSVLLLIVFSLLNLSLKIAVIQFEYTFKYKAFIEKYCENKDKPELKCNGKCHLKKSLKAGSDSQTEITQHTIFDLISFDLNSTYSSNDFFYYSPKSKIYSFNQFNYSLFQVFIDHPPQNLI